MRVLLLNPPVSSSDLYREEAGVEAVVEPFGLAYIAAVLEQGGHRVEILDGIAEKMTIDEVVKRAKYFDLVGMSAYTGFAKRAFETIRKLREATDIPIVFGGPHATSVPKMVFEAAPIDFLVSGEGEYTSRDLIEAIEMGKDVDNVAGLYFRKGKQIKFTGERPLIKNVDDIPLPARHLLKMGLYKGSDSRTKRQPSHGIITSRGCPFNCFYCHKQTFGRGFRAHSPERVLQEIDLLVEKYGARDIGIWDDNFTVNKKRVLKICDLLKERKHDLTFSCEARVDCVDDDILNALKGAGCDCIAYGIESGSQRMLDYMRKSITLEQARQTVKKTHKVGLNMLAYFMMGLPSETKKDIEKTIKFAKELNPKLATFSLFVPFPGTDAYDQIVKENGLEDPLYWRSRMLTDFNLSNKPIYVPKSLTKDEVISLHQKAYRSFYLRPSYALQRLLSIRGIEDVKIMAKGLFAVLNV